MELPRRYLWQISFIWIFSLLCLLNLLAFHAVAAHMAATHNRFDNINTFGSLAVIAISKVCYVTQAAASYIALRLALTRDSTLAAKLHGFLVAIAGWLLLYLLLHSRWPV
jgi:hypothetical protein